jgi:hypothetical protein
MLSVQKGVHNENITANTVQKVLMMTDGSMLTVSYMLQVPSTNKMTVQLNSMTMVGSGSARS